MDTGEIEHKANSMRHLKLKLSKYLEMNNTANSGKLEGESNCETLLRAYAEFQNKMRQFRDKTGSDRKMAALNNDVTSCAVNGEELLNLPILIILLHLLLTLDMF